ncbi:YtxH domain-containing protein [Robertmurraya massiliosenegalensis]|uniref:YtxH domain-containing protein n=1 Tax=Robertmurraya massiliosenegalensis TaxID=1287657 RepID=UPI0002FBAE62|nr:YtxH domain-containing protein [Robertmurraya massiliosenegalensis]
MPNNENQQREKTESGVNTKDFLIGAFIGGIVGAATALFLTPKSGKDIRNNLSEQAHSIKIKTDHLREAAVMKSSELAEVAKEKTNTIGQAVSKQSNQILNKVKALKPAGELSEGENKGAPTSEQSDIQRKLEETKRAFDETEHQLNH